MGKRVNNHASKVTSSVETRRQRTDIREGHCLLTSTPGSDDDDVTEATHIFASLDRDLFLMTPTKKAHSQGGGAQNHTPTPGCPLCARCSSATAANNSFDNVTTSGPTSTAYTFNCRSNFGRDLSCEYCVDDSLSYLSSGSYYPNRSSVCYPPTGPPIQCSCMSSAPYSGPPSVHYPPPPSSSAREKLLLLLREEPIMDCATDHVVLVHQKKCSSPAARSLQLRQPGSSSSFFLSEESQQLSRNRSTRPHPASNVLQVEGDWTTNSSPLDTSSSHSTSAPDLLRSVGVDGRWNRSKQGPDIQRDRVKLDPFHEGFYSVQRNSTHNDWLAVSTIDRRAKDVPPTLTKGLSRSATFGEFTCPVSSTRNHRPPSSLLTPVPFKIDSAIW